LVNETTAAPAALYDDITTNVLSLGTGAGEAGARELPAGLIIAGLFLNDRTIFRRIERGLTHLPSDPNLGAAEIVILPAGPDLSRVSAGLAWLDPESGQWTVVIGESLAPRQDIELWRAEQGEAGAAISVDGPRGFQLFGRKFVAIRAPITAADSLDDLLGDLTLPDARRALREGIRRRRVTRVDAAPVRIVTPQTTSMNEPGAGLTPDDPAVALPQFRFVFTEAEEFKRVRIALEQPAPDTYDLYGEALVIPLSEPAGTEKGGAEDDAEQTDTLVAVVGAMAWRRATTGWTLVIGRVLTTESLVDRWLDDGEGDLRTRVLLATVNKRGSTEQPVAIDVLCRVTDLRPEMQADVPVVPFVPGQEPVVTLARAAAFQFAGDMTTFATAPDDAHAALTATAGSAHDALP
jgi:hypothetical protein